MLSAKVILWDFDGVLMDSMKIRDKGFEVTLAEFPKEQVQQLLEYHRENGGLSRYVKFRYFYEKVLGITIDDCQVQLLASKFSEVMMKLLINEELLIKDTFEFIKKYYNDLPMHIVSGSDGRELNEICKRLNIDGYFKSIQGSPTPKKDLVADVLKAYKYHKGDVMLIGDSINDYDAAMANNIRFAGYNNPYLSSITDAFYIDSFNS